MSCAKTAEPIDLPLGLYWVVDTGGPKEVQVQSHLPGGTNMPTRAHLRHLANMIEPSICGGDAVLCQITLTTCSISALHSVHVYVSTVAAWLGRAFSISEVTLRRAWLVLGWVTICGCVNHLDL